MGHCAIAFQEGRKESGGHRIFGAVLGGYPLVPDHQVHLQPVGGWIERSGRGAAHWIAARMLRMHQIQGRRQEGQWIAGSGFATEGEVCAHDQ